MAVVTDLFRRSSETVAVVLQSPAPVVLCPQRPPAETPGSSTTSTVVASLPGSAPSTGDDMNYSQKRVPMEYIYHKINLFITQVYTKFHRNLKYTIGKTVTGHCKYFF